MYMVKSTVREDSPITSEFITLENAAKGFGLMADIVAMQLLNGECSGNDKNCTNKKITCFVAEGANIVAEFSVEQVPDVKEV